jgi:hypothetical protein
VKKLQLLCLEKETSLANYFSDVSWLQQLAYLADVFNKLNEFNLSIQDRSITVLTAEDKVASMKLKLKSLYQRVQRNKLDCFDTMNKYLEESGKAVSESVKHDTTEHLRRLQNSFEEYFPPNNNDNNWLRNPFIGSFQIEDLSIKECEQLIDIRF